MYNAAQLKSGRYEGVTVRSNTGPRDCGMCTHWTSPARVVQRPRRYMRIHVPTSSNRRGLAKSMDAPDQSKSCDSTLGCGNCKVTGKKMSPGCPLASRDSTPLATTIQPTWWETGLGAEGTYLLCHTSPFLPRSRLRTRVALEVPWKMSLPFLQTPAAEKSFVFVQQISFSRRSRRALLGAIGACTGAPDSTP